MWQKSTLTRKHTHVYRSLSIVLVESVWDIKKQTDFNMTDTSRVLENLLKVLKNMDVPTVDNGPKQDGEFKI